MNEQKTINVIALMFVIFFCIIMAFILVFPFIVPLAHKTENGEIIKDYLEKTSSFFTGMLGIIFGYYFGHRKIKTETE